MIALAARLVAISAAILGYGCTITDHPPSWLNGPSLVALTGGPPETPEMPSATAASAPDARIPSGTAFFVSREGLLLTSAHLISSCEAPAVWWRDRPLKNVRLVAIDHERDLALLATGLRIGGLMASPNRSTPQSGELVTALAFGVYAQQPLAPLLIRGYFAGIAEDSVTGPLFLIRAKIPPGASGGPVVDERGTLIGMVVGYYTDRPDLGVIASNRAIGDFLAERRIRLQHTPARTSFVSIDQLLRGATVLVQCSREQGLWSRRSPQFARPSVKRARLPAVSPNSAHTKPVTSVPRLFRDEIEDRLASLPRVQHPAATLQQPWRKQVFLLRARSLYYRI
jgi:Trypsin-like peptidase domain